LPQEYPAGEIMQPQVPFKGSCLFCLQAAGASVKEEQSKKQFIFTGWTIVRSSQNQWRVNYFTVIFFMKYAALLVSIA
jgi:hypothetical protein